MLRYYCFQSTSLPSPPHHHPLSTTLLYGWPQQTKCGAALPLLLLPPFHSFPPVTSSRYIFLYFSPWRYAGAFQRPNERTNEPPRKERESNHCSGQPENIVGYKFTRCYLFPHPPSTLGSPILLIHWNAKWSLGYRVLYGIYSVLGSAATEMAIFAINGSREESVDEKEQQQKKEMGEKVRKDE